MLSSAGDGDERLFAPPYINRSELAPPIHPLTLNSNVCRSCSHEGLTESKTTSVVYGPCRPTLSWQYGLVSPRKPSRFRFCSAGQQPQVKGGEPESDTL